MTVFFNKTLKYLEVGKNNITFAEKLQYAKN